MLCYGITVFSVDKNKILLQLNCLGANDGNRLLRLIKLCCLFNGKRFSF